MAHRKQKKLKNSSAPGVQLGMIITPMLDMSFQILAFFLMIYHPSALEGHIPGSLVPPEDFAKKSKDNTPANPMEQPLSIPEEDLNPALQESITIKVKSLMKEQEQGMLLEGAPAQIYVKTATDADPQPVYDLVTSDKKDPLKASMAALDTRLRELLKAGATGKANLKIAADGETRQQYVMLVYDTCKKAGFENIHFVPPPVLNSKITTK